MKWISRHDFNPMFENTKLKKNCQAKQSRKNMMSFTEHTSTHTNEYKSFDICIYAAEWSCEATVWQIVGLCANVLFGWYDSIGTFGTCSKEKPIRLSLFWILLFQLLIPLIGGRACHTLTTTRQTNEKQAERQKQNNLSHGWTCINWCANLLSSTHTSSLSNCETR